MLLLADGGEYGGEIWREESEKEDKPTLPKRNDSRATAAVESVVASSEEFVMRLPSFREARAPCYGGEGRDGSEGLRTRARVTR